MSHCRRIRGTEVLLTRRMMTLSLMPGRIPSLDLTLELGRAGRQANPRAGAPAWSRYNLKQPTPAPGCHRHWQSARVYQLPGVREPDFVPNLGDRFRPEIAVAHCWVLGCTVLFNGSDSARCRQRSAQQERT
eukprot:885173-Rhodomonas_salina.2